MSDTKNRFYVNRYGDKKNANFRLFIHYFISLTTVITAEALFKFRICFDTSNVTCPGFTTDNAKKSFF